MNLTLVGMPASGKSTVGVLLAKRLGYQFIDSDLLIQEQEGRLLKEIIAQEGLEAFMKIENQVNCGIDTDKAVIAPGGSVVYYEEAMNHFREIGHVVYLKLSFEEFEARIGNPTGRGVVLKPGMTLRDLYEERVPYYEKYADIVIDETGKTPGDVVDELREMAEQGKI